MNPYLQSLRDRYEGLRTGIEGLQSRAAAESRDLTETELTSVREQGEQARALHTQITDLTEIEARHADVAALAARVDTERRDEQTRGDSGQGDQTRGAVRLSGTTTRDRDPGHYRKDGGHSFFGDLFHSRSLQDETATRRLVEHNRALDMTNEGPGVIPPVWMASEFQELAVQQRKVANAVRNIPLSSAAPISMPKQSASAAANVAEQAAENDAVADADLWDSAVTTVSPKATAGAQFVSRQMLDSSNPAVDALIFDDLISSYNLKVEQKVVSALITASGAATATYATNAAWTTGLAATHATYVVDAITDAAIAVRAARKLPADILVCAVARYGTLLKVKDSTGRPLIPAGSAGPQNVVGRGNVAVDGFLDTSNLYVLATDGVQAAFPESVIVARAADTILFESPVLRFRYEEPSGPETIRLGIWAYTAVHVKYSGDSSKRLVITAPA